jgi:penicillin-binding protein A
VNAPIARLFTLVIVLFTLLVVFTSRWTVFEAQGLKDKPSNRRALLEEQRVRRGLIRADDGTVLARSVRAEAGTFERRYPEGGLFAHAVGYVFPDFGRAGLERERNRALTGEGNELSSLIDQLRGRAKEGDNVETSLDPKAQRVAIQALAGRKGAIVAMEPDTGRVRVMASVPSFNPADGEKEIRRLARSGQGAPLLNRVTQGRYPPGSTFKVVTASAAIDSGKYTPDTIIDGKSPITISGVPLQNFHGEQFGKIPLTDALTHSVNTVFAQVGEKLGIDTMAEYMERFGFYSEPPMDYPKDQMVPSGSYVGNRLLSPTSGRIDVGRMAIGQDKLQVTPLQMAEVVATIANGGVRVEPRLTTRIVDPDGRTRRTIDPKVAERVMSRESAAKVGTMMTRVVDEGTGTAAALSGIKVAGKTGTAEIDIAKGITQPWFIAYAPADRPKIAIAVTIERSTGQGGIVAAPIAKQVLEALL